jgi:hypothetical protein
MRQARLALLQAGLYSNLDTIFNALPVNIRTAAIIEWEYALFISRNSPTVAMLAAALNITSDQLDALFIAANNIED